MKRNAVTAVLASCALILAACGTNAAPAAAPAKEANADEAAAEEAAPEETASAAEKDAPEETEIKAEEAVPEETESAETEAAAEEASSDKTASVEEAADAEEESNAEDTSVPADEPEEARAMSRAELSFFTDLFRTQEYYGFLQSAYDSPADINWNLVFYTQGDNASDKEAEAYLKAVDQEEIFTNLVRLDGSYIRDFVLSSTGEEFDPETARFSWYYLEDMDTYFHEVSDTNYAEVTCTEGTVLGDTYTIRYHDAFLWSAELTGEVTIRYDEENDRYLFVSNRTLWEEKAVYQEKVSTTEFGDVTFAVFEEPDSEWNPGCFIFIRNGEQEDLVPSPIVRRFHNARFVSCDDVLFDDFDGDGATDLIIIGTFDIDGKKEQHAGYYAGEMYNYESYGGSKGYMNLDDKISVAIEENVSPLTAEAAAKYLSARR